MADRLYRVTEKTGNPPKSRLFKAGTKNQVESHLTAETWDIEVASSMDVAAMMAAGAKVEDAKKDA